MILAVLEETVTKNYLNTFPQIGEIILKFMKVSTEKIVKLYKIKIGQFLLKDKI